jgi:hypothetical protein
MWIGQAGPDQVTRQSTDTSSTTIPTILPLISWPCILQGSLPLQTTPVKPRQPKQQPKQTIPSLRAAGRAWAPPALVLLVLLAALLLLGLLVLPPVPLLRLCPAPAALLPPLLAPAAAAAPLLARPAAEPAPGLLPPALVLPLPGPVPLPLPAPVPVPVPGARPGGRPGPLAPRTGTGTSSSSSSAPAPPLLMLPVAAATPLAAPAPDPLLGPPPPPVPLVVPHVALPPAVPPAVQVPPAALLPPVPLALPPPLAAPSLLLPVWPGPRPTLLGPTPLLRLQPLLRARALAALGPPAAAPGWEAAAARRLALTAAACGRGSGGRCVGRARAALVAEAEALREQPCTQRHQLAGTRAAGSWGRARAHLRALRQAGRPAAAGARSCRPPSAAAGPPGTRCWRRARAGPPAGGRGGGRASGRVGRVGRRQRSAGPEGCTPGQTPWPRCCRERHCRRAAIVARQQQHPPPAHGRRSGPHTRARHPPGGRLPPCPSPRCLLSCQSA